MSDFDTFVRNHIAYPILPLLGLLVVFYLSKGYINLFRKRAFVALSDIVCTNYLNATENIKRQLFSPLHDIVSQDWKLKNEGRIRVLEIGIGTGVNLKYFPKSCHLLALDSNEEVQGKLNENLKKYPHIEAENIISEAEDMSDMKDNSVDAVVCTLVLCSVRSPRDVLKEVKRVLVPGGKFFFLEHVHADSGTFLNKVQSVLTWTKIWPMLFLGCELNRRTGEKITEAGFKEVELNKIEVKIDKFFIFKAIKSHICGVAVK